MSEDLTETVVWLRDYATDVERKRDEAEADAKRWEVEAMRLADLARTEFKRAERLIIQRDAVEKAGKEIVQTAEGLLSENKRLKAELEALTKSLIAAGVHPNLVEEIKIEARNGDAISVSLGHRDLFLTLLDNASMSDTLRARVEKAAYPDG